MSTREKLFKGLLPILVLDDEVEITKSLSRDLRRHATVDVFTDPREAVKALSAKTYSVILSDLKMPHMNGLEFLGECRQIQPQAQRILLTAYIDLASLPDSINKAQLNFILTKPWEPSDLQEVVERFQRLGELERENEELRRLALTDGLTGVANHRYFWERLDSEFSRAKRYGRPLSLIMGDVDDFKKINDKEGHQRGDEILRLCAQALSQGQRISDTVARYGGEEFAIILPEVSRPKAIEIAERHLSKVDELAKVGMSFGVASYPDDASSSTELVERADRALLKAKESGKHRVLSALDLSGG
jgi:two-component system, cell cycle response regulator